MEKFIRTPDVELIDGIIVTKDTNIEFNSATVHQKISDLKMVTETHVEAEAYTGDYKTTVLLEEGDVLLLPDNERGYVKPVEHFVTIKEAIDTLKCVEE